MKPSPWEAEVVRVWSPRLRAWARGVGGLENVGRTADDAFQELLIAAIVATRSWAANSDEPPPEPWLWLAVRRKRGKLFRHVKRHTHPTDQLDVDAENESAHQPVADTPDPEVAVAGARRQSRLTVVVSTLRGHLSPEQWRLLTLRHCEGRDPAEIAEVLGDGTTARQVSRALYRARSEARDILGVAGIAPVEPPLESTRCARPAEPRPTDP